MHFFFPTGRKTKYSREKKKHKSFLLAVNLLAELYKRSVKLTDDVTTDAALDRKVTKEEASFKHELEITKNIKSAKD